MIIGRCIHLFRDESRWDAGAPDKSTKVRTIPVTLFYPAHSDGLPGDSVRPSSYADLFAPSSEKALELLALMGVDPDYMKRMETGICENAEVSEAGSPFPVVLFSPAFGVVKDMYTYFAKELVNRGYVVVTLGSPYESIFSVMPGGSLVRQSELVSQIRNNDKELWEALLEQRVRDLLFVLDRLEDWNDSNGTAPINMRFDLTSVAVAGHSLGGAGAYEALSRDSRLRTGILLDPSFHLIREEYHGRANVPLLIMREQNTTADSLKGQMSDEVALPLVEGVRQLTDSYSGFLSMVKIIGADHMTFSDVPLHYQNEDVEAKHVTINRLAGSFLDQFLKHRGSSYSDLLSLEPAEPFKSTNRQGESSP
ncbi:alpha/beta hydrolase family protein [Paenibacillus sp. GCM10012303]|uniref:alpha/beta hydrolase family protein n=1 Tax=Paenibacillus sp. GCM10012303 TaxID=3317340 RepID=UPI0036178ED3